MTEVGFGVSTKIYLKLSPKVGNTQEREEKMARHLAINLVHILRRRKRVLREERYM